MTLQALNAALAERGVLEAENARLRAAAGLRNLLAHQYGAIEIDRVFEFAGSRLADLTTFCAAAAWCQVQDT